MKKEGDCVEALLTEDGKIVAVGSYEQLKTKAQQEVNLNGSVLYPGFIDTHMHMIGYGASLRNLDLSKITSVKALVARLKEASRSIREGEWLLGEGWDENNFPDQKLPTLKQLDDITDAPILLKRTCRHAVLVNSSLLSLAQICKETPDPEGGVIERDEAGNPTGYLHESAQQLVLKLLPKPTAASLTTELETAVDHLLSLGLTSAVTDDLGYYGDYHNPYEAFRNVIAQRKNFKAYLLRRDTIFEQMMESNISDDLPYMELGPMKIFVDGALGGRTALLSEPYTDSYETLGVAVHSDDRLEELVQLARNYNEAIAVHVIGDAAVEKIVSLIERYPAPSGKVDRLIHVNVLRKDLVARMKKLSVVLDIQPVFVASDFPWAQERLGRNRMLYAYAWKTLLDEGFLCGGGSDAPIEGASPLLGIYAAVARKMPGNASEGYSMKEALSIYEAIKLFTSSAAKTIGKEHCRGRLVVGYEADFTVIEEDLFHIPESTIPQATVVMTVVDGNIVYERESVDEQSME